MDRTNLLITKVGEIDCIKKYVESTYDFLFYEHGLNYETFLLI